MSGAGQRACLIPTKPGSIVLGKRSPEWVVALTAESFDDGRTDVPGGITGRVERVIVVGAGMAGLTVANALTQAGTDCVVLEARDRIGGRLHTVDLAGSPVDLGGSWIHMPGGNPMTAFARQAGVARRSADPVPEMAGFDLAEDRRLSAAEAGELLGFYDEGFPAATAELTAELGPDASAAQGIEAFVAQAGLGLGPARRARQMLYGCIEAESADLAERQSLRWMWNEREYDGNYFGDVPDGGYRRLTAAMAAGLDLRLGTEVTDVAVMAGGVRVRTADGRSEAGSHVVVTVPLGVLKRGAPRFSPRLPPDRLAAIGRLGFGRFEKVALRFDEPFWRAAGFPHLMLFPRDPGEWMVWVMGLDAFGAGPVLVFFVFHSAAGRLMGTGRDGTDHSKPVRWALGQLAEAIGRPCPAPSAVAVTSWAADPYSCGSYSHIPPGSSPADADLLGEPVGGRLLFAGEHTQSARLAYADGALTSGIREAKRLLGQPSVRLGPAAPSLWTTPGFRPGPGPTTASAAGGCRSRPAHRTQPRPS
jgi:monoamine oxidase